MLILVVSVVAVDLRTLVPFRQPKGRQALLLERSRRSFLSPRLLMVTNAQSTE
jgi:hypothetical protein